MERVYLFSRHADDIAKVGVWQITDGLGQFQYHPDWLAREEAFALDPAHLPLGSEMFETTRRGGVFGVFEDAGPDSWGERVLSHEHPARVLGATEKLLYASGRNVGCLMFSASRERPKAVKAATDWQDLTRAQEGVDRLIAGEVVSEELMNLLEPGSSLGGARPKITVQKDGRLWLAKFPRQDDTYDVPRTEFATMQLARTAGIEVPDVELVALPDGRAVLLVERFDQRDGRACHYISAHSLVGLERVREDDALGSYSYAGIAWRIRQHAPADQARSMQADLYRRMVFNVFCRNTDDHMRNHGFLVDAAGVHLSPAFDIVPQPGKPPVHAIGVGPEGRQASLPALLRDAHRFALTDEQALDIVNDIAAAARAGRHLYRQANIGARDLERIEACFSLVPSRPLQAGAETASNPMKRM